MRKLDEINKEITDILALDSLKMAKREKSAYSKRIVFLKMCRNLLETSPNVEFYKQEKERLKKLIEGLSKQVPSIAFYPPNFTGNRNTYFNKKMGITGYKTQIKTLDFIFK